MLRGVTTPALVQKWSTPLRLLQMLDERDWPTYSHGRINPRLACSTILLSLAINPRVAHGMRRLTTANMLQCLVDQRSPLQRRQALDCIASRVVHHHTKLTAPPPDAKRVFINTALIDICRFHRSCPLLYCVKAIPRSIVFAISSYVSRPSLLYSWSVAPCWQKGSLSFGASYRHVVRCACPARHGDGTCLMEAKALLFAVLNNCEALEARTSSKRCVEGLVFRSCQQNEHLM